MKKIRLLTTAAALMLTMSMILGGCGAGSATSAKEGGQSGGQTAQQEASKDGEKILKFATHWEKQTFDPALWGDGGSVKAGISMFETLAAFDEDRNIVPCLAESWEVSDDNKTYTFHLRKGVQFHAGYGEFTSEDVAYTLERLNDPDVGATDVKTKCKVDNIESMDTSDPYTFVLHLKEPDNEMLMDFASWYTNIICKKAYEELKPSGFGAAPVGTGPFEYESGKPSEFYVVKRFEDYWGEKPALDKIQITMLADETSRVNAYNAGEVDMISLNDSNSILKFRDTEGCEVKTISGAGCYYLGMNTEKEPFNNRKVREALKYAINYDEMLNDYWSGTILPPTGYVQSYCIYAATPEETGYTYEYNPEKAKALLAEAGYPDGFSTSVSSPNDSLSKGPLLIIQQYLAEVGVDMEIQLSEFATFLDDVRNGRDDMWFLVNGDGYRGDQWLTSFTSAKIPGSNWCMFKNEEFDELIEKGVAATEKSEKEKYFTEAQKLLVREIPSIPISESTGDYLVRDNVKNFSMSADLLLQFKYMDVE